MKTERGDKDRSVSVFSAAENQCIWMKAGVVNFKLCENAYDCMTCPFDKAMSRESAAKPTALVTWREVKRGKPYFQRECRHMLTGRIQIKFCGQNYECRTCEYDQLLDEEDLSAPPPATGVRKVEGFAVADGYYYHKGHSWARIEHGGFLRVGLDDFASRLLGGPTEICLPPIGSRLVQGEKGWTIHRGEMSADVLSPVSGMVLATNQNAVRTPGVANKDPYNQGWLVVVHPRTVMKKVVKDLLFERSAVSWLKGEVKKLEDISTAAYGHPVAATGGEIVDDIFGNLHNLKWEELVHQFLLT
ncbi:MAG: glycine cleavage system protein H [Syntrophobacteraceae bacterium]|nr:glycine cleavage system protein H [Syntrophobacteraceae bacterium]